MFMETTLTHYLTSVMMSQRQTRCMKTMLSLIKGLFYQFHIFLHPFFKENTFHFLGKNFPLFKGISFWLGEVPHFSFCSTN